MKVVLSQLITAIASARLLRSEDLAMLDADGLLTLRDGAPFDTAWAQAFEHAQSLPASAVDEPGLTRLREAAFKAVYDATSNADLASYVGDDFDLVGRFLCAGVDSAVAASLLDAYVRNEVPSSIRAVAPLEDVIAQL